MSSKHVNLVKLCVGASSVEQLVTWQSERMRSGVYPVPEHVTRSRPRRAEEVLDGGSLYWVFRGQILARQRITGLEMKGFRRRNYTVRHYSRPEHRQDVSTTASAVPGLALSRSKGQSK